MTIANALSLSRLLLSFSAFALLTTWEWRSAFATLLLSLAAISDALDGHISRKQGTESRFGAYFDLLADHVFITCTSLVLLKTGQLSLWFVLIVFLRTITTMIARAYDARQLDIPHKTRVGVTATILFYLTVIFTISDSFLPIPFLPLLLQLAAAVFAAAGLSEYLYWFIKKRDLA